MDQYSKQAQQVIKLLRQLSINLEHASKGKLSTNDKTPERLLWEIFNKIFSILVICENSVLKKDSLTIHLIARYSYEILIVFAYIFFDNSKMQERAEQFISFNQFKNTNRKWTDKTYAQMLESIPNGSRFAMHKKHYRNLSNFAHPTMDSFLLNRRGDDNEFHMILNTVLLTIGTILEIIKICIDENLHFNNKQKGILDIENISTTTDRIMKELQIL